VRLRRAPGSQAVASQLILAPSYGAAVMRVATTTRPVVADIVIEFHARGDGADLSLVPNAMDKKHSPIDGHLAVPSAFATLPNIAAVRVGDPSDPRGFSALPRRIEHRNKLASCHAANITLCAGGIS
jgi:hypothetical protein